MDGRSGCYEATGLSHSFALMGCRGNAGLRCDVMDADVGNGGRCGRVSCGYTAVATNRPSVYPMMVRGRVEVTLVRPASDGRHELEDIGVA